MKHKIIVIGGVATGPTAAAKAKRVNPDAEIVLYEKGDHISYGVCEIPYFLSGEVQNKDSLIIYSPERFQKEKMVTVRTHHLIESINPKKHSIEVRDLESGRTNEEFYDRLIIATGNRPKRISVEGERARNVFYIKTYADAISLKQYLMENLVRSAAVIGSGFIGMEMAETFSKLGIEVTMVTRSSSPLSLLERSSREFVSNQLETNLVRFIPERTVEWFGIGAKNTVVAVGLRDRTIETDIVVIATGVEPNSDIARSAGIKIGKKNGILVNDRMHVEGADNIFSAGDCCELKNIITKKPMYLSLATTASKSGRIAGTNAAGGNVRSKGFIRAIGIRSFDMEIAQVGLSSSEASEFDLQHNVVEVSAKSRASMMEGAENLFFTLLSEKKSERVLGANIIGKEGAVQRANVIAAAIRQGCTLSDLSDLDLIYAPPFAPLWDGILLSAMKSKNQNKGFYEKRHGH